MLLNKIISFIKRNILVLILLIIIIFLVTGRRSSVYNSSLSYSDAGVYESADYAQPMTSAIGMKSISSRAYIQPVAPTPEITNRKMITNTNFSLQVKNVTETVSLVKSKIQELGGYIVNVYISRPEVGEASTLSFRVPTEKIDTVTTFLRSQAIKVVSENVSGTDITDQYVDIEERLRALEDTKKRLNEILASAKTVDDIINVQSRIFEIQSQVDSYKGQLKYMDSASSTSLVTVYLATDESGLPYTQPLSWRPEVIFKYAVRSLISTLQGIGSIMIWLGVYSVIIVPVLTIILIITIIKKRSKKNSQV